MVYLLIVESPRLAQVVESSCILVLKVSGPDHLYGSVCMSPWCFTYPPPTVLGLRVLATGRVGQEFLAIEKCQSIETKTFCGPEQFRQKFVRKVSSDTGWTFWSKRESRDQNFWVSLYNGSALATRLLAVLGCLRCSPSMTDFQRSLFHPKGD